MAITVQARLDKETQAILEKLRRGGRTTSDLIREGILLLAKETPV